ncbi:MAG: hypothetical protein J6C87_02910 [Bacteroides sp.]|nr:hypothetical protein [Bacteroides sp.]
MKSKRTFITLCISFLLLSTSVFAQESSTLEKLMNKEWYFDYEGSQGIEPNKGKIFGTEKITYFTDYSEGRKIYYGYFYLSDTIETTFDESKLGKNVNGKYIINPITIVDKNGKETKTAGVCEILELTETKLVIQNVKHKAAAWSKLTYRTR